MKTILIAIIAILLRSCDVVAPDPKVNLSIKTEYPAYTISNQFSAKVFFKNNLGEEVKIYNNGCGFPDFILQKLVDGKWVSVGGPWCIAMAWPPTTIKHKEQIESTVRMYVDEAVTNGTYRMNFHLIRTSKNNQTIDEKYLVSNNFEIRRQL